MKDTSLSAPPYEPSARGGLERLAIRVTDWSERWFPDSYIFAAIAVVVVAIGAMLIGATNATAPRAVRGSEASRAISIEAGGETATT